MSAGGSVGLNLTCCSRVVLMDPWWNPSIESQVRFGYCVLTKIWVRVLNLDLSLFCLLGIRSGESSGPPSWLCMLLNWCSMMSTGSSFRATWRCVSPSDESFIDILISPDESTSCRKCYKITIADVSDDTQGLGPGNRPTPQSLIHDGHVLSRPSKIESWNYRKISNQSPTRHSEPRLQKRWTSFRRPKCCVR